ncbi:hypothetical protein [Allosphingosinicella indica]|uniref:hypothetical protein n=1 Tax=Allosphingosinicella indica TaxID=941907 RepID=UPI001FCE23B1|nr:hypothetical protein [Allosphingosinicella indica]
MAEIREPVDDFARLRPPVDQIAQKDDEGARHWPAGKIILDLRQKIVQQVEAAVNITDGIRTRILGALPRRRGAPQGRRYRFPKTHKISVSKIRMFEGGEGYAPRRPRNPASFDLAAP